jgi:hypothetical protein
MDYTFERHKIGEVYGIILREWVLGDDYDAGGFKIRVFESKFLNR